MIITIMASLKLGIFLLAIGVALCANDVCFNDMRESGRQFRKAINNLNKTQNLSSFIEEIANFTKTVPLTLDDCNNNFLADRFRQNLPNTCIDDVSKALQIGVKLINETDNEVAFGFDMIRLERIYDKKIKKDCPGFQNVSLQQIIKKGECAQASYDLSVLVQKFLADIEHGDENKAVDDFIVVLQNLPDTLEQCGQTNLADKLRRDLPRECLSSIDVFGKSLVELEYHYDHLEWVYKNFKRIYKDFKQVTYTCPVFG